MANRDSEIIKQFGEQIFEDFKKAIPVVSGKTRDSLQIAHREKGFDLSISAHVNALINGRKPTGSGAKKGSPTLQQSILEWIKAKGITPRESSMTQISLSWAISKSIHRDGFKGKGNFFNGILTESRLKALTDTILDNNAPVITSNIIKQFDFK